MKLMLLPLRLCQPAKLLVDHVVVPLFFLSLALQYVFCREGVTNGGTIVHSCRVMSNEWRVMSEECEKARGCRLKAKGEEKKSLLELGFTE